MDTGVIADGLRRHSRVGEAEDLENRLLRACASFGLAEFFRGDEGADVRINTEFRDRVLDGRLHRLEQPPQRTQGWTVTRVWRILRERGLARVEAADLVEDAA